MNISKTNRASISTITFLLTVLFAGVIVSKNIQAGSGSDTQPTSSGDAENKAQPATKSEGNPNAEQFAAVMAMDGDKEYGEYLGGECLACHAPETESGSIPQIHGKDKDYLVNALLEYKNKQRENEVMRGVAAALSNEEIAALAAYLSKP